MEGLIAEPPDDSPWGPRQPKFQSLVTDGPGRYFVVGQTTSGEPIGVQLAAVELRTDD